MAIGTVVVPGIQRVLAAQRDTKYGLYWLQILLFTHTTHALIYRIGPYKWHCVSTERVRPFYGIVYHMRELGHSDA